MPFVGLQRVKAAKKCFSWVNIRCEFSKISSKTPLIPTKPCPRTRAEAQAAGRQPNVPSVARPQPVSTGHDQQHPEWHGGPVRDVQHHHETQTQGEQLQGLCFRAEARHRLGASSLDLEPGLHEPLRGVMYHTYYTLLGYCSCEVGAGAAWDCRPLKAFKIRSLASDTSHWIFIRCLSPAPHLKESPCAGKHLTSSLHELLDVVCVS